MDATNNVQVPEVMDMFHPLPEKCGIDDVKFIEYHPIAAVDSNNPIEFQIHGSGDQYMDLSRTYLYLKVKVERNSSDSTDSQPDAYISCANLWLHSMFESVEVQLQQKVLFNSSKMYPYKSMIECLTSLTSDKEPVLTKEMFYRDNAFFMENIDPKDPASLNTGYLQRNEKIRGEQECEMFGRLGHDFMQMKRPVLLNGVSVSVKLQHATNQFRLMSNADYAKVYKLTILSARLRVCKVVLAPNLYMAHGKIMAKDNPAIYPVDKTEMSSHVLHSGSAFFSFSDMFQNRVPHYLVIAFVASEAFEGSYKRNPFNFHHFNLSSLTVYRDGQAVPHKPLELDFTKNQYIEAYQNFYDENTTGGSITFKEFGGGYALYVYRLDDSAYDRHCLPPKRRGNVTIEGRFASALPENVNIILYSKFPETIKIDQYRNVTP